MVALVAGKQRGQYREECDVKEDDRTGKKEETTHDPILTGGRGIVTA
jgi:hypothetical protein